MRRSGTLAVLAWASLLVGFTSVRDPHHLEPVRWGSPGATFYVHAAGSDDVADDSELTAFTHALERWSTVACSAFAYVHAGLVGDAVINPGDGVNTLMFVEADWPAYASGTIAFAPWEVETVGERHTLVGVDVILNGTTSATWSTSGALGTVDVQGIATHELGHALGLWHSGRADATMYFASKTTGVHGRTLADDDQRGACFLYPRAGAVCDAAGECPLFYDWYGAGGNVRTTCVAGACQAGLGADGADCNSGSHCATGQCTPDPFPQSGANPGLCSAACTVGTPCGVDGWCSDRTGVATCYESRVDCAFDDAECGAGKCVWDLDARFRCRMPCATDDECEGEQICHRREVEGATGYCRERGAKPDGALCEDAMECARLQCGGEIAACGAVPPAEPDPTEEEPPAEEPPPSTEDPPPPVEEPPLVEEPTVTHEVVAEDPLQASSDEASKIGLIDVDVRGGCSASGGSSHLASLVLVGLLMRRTRREGASR